MGKPQDYKLLASKVLVAEHNNLLQGHKNPQDMLHEGKVLVEVHSDQQDDHGVVGGHSDQQDDHGVVGVHSDQQDDHGVL